MISTHSFAPTIQPPWPHSFFEPVVGATLGAVPAVDGYTARIAEICRKHGILLIADEVMTGMGRTGKPFASLHWGLEPDIILTGKGIASGYAPLGAVLVAPHVAEAFEKGTAAFMHGFTYQSHPVATAAGNAVFDYLETHKLFERVTPAGESLRKALSVFENHSHVGQVRGLGLLQGVEFVKNKSTREPFPKRNRHRRKNPPGSSREEHPHVSFARHRRRYPRRSHSACASLHHHFAGMPIDCRCATIRRR
jgi:Adenosylmethionine-8-amino-7-oxononanoate aminotransferase